MKAIEQSCIAIIVFSENYASSQWCLEEVAKIMECKEQTYLTVLPVFYKVDPREVRGGRKSYGKALSKHESKFRKDLEKVKRWKKALFDAGSLSGWHLSDGDESELIQRIVKEISTHLDRSPLHVAKHPVGIDSRVVKLEWMLNLKAQDNVVMVGLWGQGGIGKTTLAKALYNTIFRQFEGSCLLANVREASKDSKGLVLLQEKLLSEILILQQRLEVSSVDKGINLIQHRLRHKKILLILDDVDDLCQLNALASEGKWFGGGSKIIITTRDKHLLTCHGINQDHIYEVKALDDSEAHELLSKHAFPTQPKLEIGTDLVDGVLNLTKGLPLALEKLSRVPNSKINDVLKISYDGLEENEKEIFLDIACFFKGKNSEYVEKVLDSCDLEAIIGLEILMERSLIRIGFTIEMHDLIQFMGMEIVNQECRDDPDKRSRLWRHDDVFNVLSGGVGDCAVKAIVLELPEPTKMCIGLDAFTKMRRLRLLILCNVHDTFQGPLCLPDELRWFEWPGCARGIPEFSSSPKKLVGLDMPKSSIAVVPKQFKVSISLLTELILAWNNITSLPTSINKHGRLSLLHVQSCHQLKEIPELPPLLNFLLADGCESLQKTGGLTSFHNFVPRGLAMANISPPDQQNTGRYMICLPGEEIPRWVLPIEDDSVFFMASKELYGKFLGFVLCAVLNSNRIWLEYFIPSKLWGVVDFGQTDGGYAQFSLRVSGGIVKKWGFRIICKQLEDDLEVVLEDNELIDPALLYEVAHESTDSEA
ncbi:disease resistance protein RUN1-like [Rhodamnia argentea]|uniref:Disease resistance protein RUN1-like n=1 Tax=Rhodamnia argentea TaxID=178133 RepID=A0ABM3H4M5_9MYRT|nr:disease resistance protein RUN1-like [Rhodamnia argentea]